MQNNDGAISGGNLGVIYALRGTLFRDRCTQAVRALGKLLDIVVVVDGCDVVSCASTVLRARAVHHKTIAPLVERHRHSRIIITIFEDRIWTTVQWASECSVGQVAYFER